MFDIDTMCYLNVSDECYKFEDIEAGETIYPESPEEILSGSFLPINIEMYYKTRKVELKRIEKKLRKMSSYLDLVLTAKYVSYKMFIEEKLDEVKEFVAQLPDEIRRRLKTLFKFTLWLNI